MSDFEKPRQPQAGSDLAFDGLVERWLASHVTAVGDAALELDAPGRLQAYHDPYTGKLVWYRIDDAPVDKSSLPSTIIADKIFGKDTAADQLGRYSRMALDRDLERSTPGFDSDRTAAEGADGWQTFILVNGEWREVPVWWRPDPNPANSPSSEYFPLRHDPETDFQIYNRKILSLTSQNIDTDAYDRLTTQPKPMNFKSNQLLPDKYPPIRKPLDEWLEPERRYDDI